MREEIIGTFGRSIDLQEVDVKQNVQRSVLLAKSDRVDSKHADANV